MKKNVKKLVIDRETVRSLEVADLASAIGGVAKTYDARCPGSAGVCDYTVAGHGCVAGAPSA